MHRDSLLLEPVGYVSTPWKSLEECPHNVDPEGPECSLFLYPPFRDAIDGLERGSEILVLYWLHRADRDRLRQRGRRDGRIRGTFSIRSPHRPNPIAAAVVHIQRIETDDRSIVVRGLDCLDHTPLLDIKPVMRHER